MNEQSISALHHLFDEFFVDYYRLNPLQATFDGVPGFNDQLPAEDEQYLEQVHSCYRHYLDKLTAFDRHHLGIDDQISYAIMEHQIQSVLRLSGYHTEYMPINQFTGLHLYMAMLGSDDSVQPFKDLKDYNNWLSRCKAFVRWTEVAIENMRKGIAVCLVLPKILVHRVIDQLESLIRTGEASVFYQPVRSFPESIDAATRRELTTAFDNMIERDMNGSLFKLLVFLKEDYLPCARAGSGLSELPLGKEMYLDYIFASVTREEDPEAIYELGLREVDRIKAEMMSIKAELGFKGSLKDLFDFMKTDRRFFPFSTDQEVLDAYQSVYDRIKPNLSKYFGIVPSCPFEIRKTEEYRAASASAEYVPGDPAAGRPGVFYVPVIDPLKINVTSDEMESLFLHEAIPGHHYQISIQYENDQIPLIRQKYWSSAVGEGWALYCESLGEQLGVLTDPYHKLGALGAEMHRAVRLVVDTGLHLGKMNREEAIEYNVAQEPITPEAAAVEIERYMAWPAQALAYKIGELKIKFLRDKYRSQLGSSFDLKAFHDTILKGGVMPLEVFETYMDDWAKGLSDQ